MNEEWTQQLAITTERLAGAAEALEKALSRLDAQQEALSGKVDRIVAAIEERLPEQQSAAAETAGLQARIAELEQANRELKAQTGRLSRKTMPALVSALLSKNLEEGEGKIDPATLEKTLSALSVEQRIAVKAEMARAGIIA